MFILYQLDYRHMATVEYEFLRGRILYEYAIVSPRQK